MAKRLLVCHVNPCLTFLIPIKAKDASRPQKRPFLSLFKKAKLRPKEENYGTRRFA